MKDKNWYRNITWDEAINNSFFSKLNRIRNKGMQAQYLNRQAGALAYTKDTELMKVAEYLLNKQLREYSDITMYVSVAFRILGDIYGFGKNYDKAIDYYKQAIDFEEKYPQFISGADTAYAELVVKTERKDLYNEVEKIFSENRYSDLIFPFSRYFKYTVLSIINKHKGYTEKAKYYAAMAEESAVALSNHKTLGLIGERDKILDRLVQKE